MNLSTIKHLFLTYQKYLGKRMYIVFALTLMMALMEGFGITLLLPLIEMADTGGADYDSGLNRTIHAILSFFGVAGSIGGTLVFIAMVFVAKGMFNFAGKAYKGLLQANLLRELKGMMYDAYNNMDYRYYIKRNTGHFINVINGQVSQTVGSFSNFMQFLTQLIMAMSYLAIAFFIAWNFALMAIGLGFVLLLLFQYLNTYVKKLSRKAAREGSVLNKFLVQTLQSFKYIRSTGQNQHLRKGVMKSINLLRGYQLRKTIAGAFTTSLQEPLSVMFMIMIVAIQLLILGAEIGPILVALMLFYRGLRSIIGLQSSWQSTMNTMGSIEMVQEEFAATTQHKEKDGHIKIDPLARDVEFKDVTFTYPESEGAVIKNLNLTIPACQTIAIVGESGAGKTTLADMLSLMLPPHEGDIYIDGVPGKDINRQSLRTQIGYVSQETVVFDDTIANNISLWKGDYCKDPKVKEKIEEAARKAYADIFINELPEGFETVVGDRGVRLSGGQRQRLFIARELFKNPRLLILDEATSALDTESERYIQEGIDQLKGTMTVVIIAHRLSTIKNADIIYVMDHGKIIESGSYEELTKLDEGRFRRMVSVQKV